MSPWCDKCGEHVSPTYYRTRKGNDGKLRGCPACTTPAERERHQAGVEADYKVRTDADGRTGVSGGEQA